MLEAASACWSKAECLTAPIKSPCRKGSMPFSDQYRRQVTLLIRVVPLVAQEACFALKGGTAINLFVRALPRLSVDIDLTYLPVQPRDQSLKEIEAALRRIAG